MRKEISFDEYIGAMQIVKAYERQRRTPLRDDKEVDRVREIKIMANKFIDDFKCDKKHGRHTNIKYYRFSISHWLKKHTQLSYPFIGRILGGYDHATIIHHCKEFERESSLKPNQQHILHRDAISQIEKYLGHLTKNNFKNLEPAISDFDNEGSFFISNN